MTVLSLRKCFRMLIKEKSSLSKDEGQLIHLIPTAFKEETSILEDEAILMLKQVYVSYNWQLRKKLLDLVEDLSSQDSLIGSSNKSRAKDISCACWEYLLRSFKILVSICLGLSIRDSKILMKCVSQRLGKD